MVRLSCRTLTFCLLSILCVSAAYRACAEDSPSKINSNTGAEPGYRFKSGGWTYVHLEGTPGEIGFQHGRLLSAEIADMVAVVKLENVHQTERDWEFFREASQKMLWPHIDEEYQEELEGIARGLQSKGVKLDVWDIVALNAGIELPQYYVPWLNKRQHASNAPNILPSGRCSPSSPPEVTPKAARSSSPTTTGPPMQKARVGR
jgi:hypothetical protein